MPIKSISAVWYPVGDWERARAFYSEGLGLQLGQHSDEAGFAAYSVSSGSLPFFIVRRPDLVGGQAGAVVTFEVSDVEAILASVRSHGGSVETEIQESHEQKIFTVRDPDGNAIELSEPKG